MKNKNRKIVLGYVKELRKTLTCSNDVKKAILHEIELQVLELENRIQVLTIDDLYNEIGSPQEIAQGFDSKTDIERIRKNAAKYRKAKIICLICAILALIAVVIAFAIVSANDDYHSSIQSNSTIEEVTS